MPVPDFSPGEVLTAAAMDSIGLWLVKTQTIGTTVTSVPVLNAFSSDFTNYRIVIDGVTSSVQQNMLFQFYAGGAPVGGANYGGMGFFQLGAAALNGNWGITGTFWETMPMNTSGLSHCAFDLFAPNKAQWSRANGFGGMNNAVGFMYNGVHQLATAYTDFRIVVTGGTITGGTIRVYGYRD